MPGKVVINGGHFEQMIRILDPRSRSGRSYHGYCDVPFLLEIWAECSKTNHILHYKAIREHATLKYNDVQEKFICVENITFKHLWNTCKTLVKHLWETF